MSDTKRYSRGHLLSVLATAFCVLTAIFLLINRQYVVDQMSVWQYQPTSDIVALAERSGMDDNGKFLFYVAQPAVENAQKFNQECDRKENSTAILGCYNGRNIYIYNVTDKRLDGIKEVTAAHEMLHVAYVRLGDNEKKKINALLEAEYDKLKNDEEFSERMAFYARTEPGERDNELHSVIGTEVATISPELEKHYEQYFTDRGKTVALHKQYASVFASLQAKSKQLSTQLKQLGDKILADRARYDAEAAQFEADKQAFIKRSESDGFNSRDEYENELDALNGRVDYLNDFHARIEDDFEEYQALKTELAGIASQSEELNRSIDSSLAPAPKL